jgi:hypothetical protein
VRLIVIHSQNFSKIFLFLLTVQLIFTRSLRKATFPFLFIWNLVFKIGFGTLSHKHLRNVARGSRSVVRAPHIRCVQCVQETYSKNCTQQSLRYHRVTTMCAMCAGCAGIFKLLTEFFKNINLFFKTNFNLNLPCTHCTHLANPCGCGLFSQIYPAHITAHTLHTWVYSLHTRPANHDSLTIYHGV